MRMPNTTHVYAAPAGRPDLTAFWPVKLLPPEAAAHYATATSYRFEGQIFSWGRSADARRKHEPSPFIIDKDWPLPRELPIAPVKLED